MKKARRPVALLLALLLCLCFAGPAYADEGEDGEYGTKDDTGTITVQGIDSTDAITVGGTIKVTAYPILTATYDENGNFAGYVALYEGYEPDLYVKVTMSDGHTLYGIEEDIAEMAEEYMEDEENEGVEYVSWAYVYEFKEEDLNEIEALVLAGNGWDIDTDDSGNIYADALANSYELTANSDGTFSGDVAPGSYLIVVSGTAEGLYNPAVASTYYTTVEGSTSNTLVAGELDMSSEDAWLKKDHVTIDKYISSEGDNVADNQSGASFDIGDVIEYTVVVGPIPEYEGDYPIFDLTDTMAEGLEYYTDDEHQLKVEVYESSDPATWTDENGNDTGTVLTNTDDQTYYTLTDADTHGEAHTGTTSINIDFVQHSEDPDDNTGEYELNDYEGDYLAITYYAELTDEAALDWSSNDNDVVLAYSINSFLHWADLYDDDSPYDPDDPDNLHPDDPRRSQEDITHVYTFDIDGILEGGLIGDITYDILTKTAEGTWVEDDEGQNGHYEYPPMEGAQFTLYTDYDCENVYHNGDATTSEDNIGSNHFAGVITTGEDGKISISGLEVGTYYLKETKAPSGYTLNTTLYKIVISASYNDDGTLANWEIAIYSKDASGATVDNVNYFGPDTEKMGEPPETVWHLEGDNTFSFEQEVAGTYFENVVIEGPEVVGETTFTAEIPLGTDPEDTTEVEFELAEIVGLEENDQLPTAGTVQYVYEAHIAVPTYDEEGYETHVTSYAITAIRTDTYVDGTKTGESWSVTLDTMEGNETRVINTKIIILPDTGGIGTGLFTLIGCLLMTTAAVCWVNSRRRRARART